MAHDIAVVGMSRFCEPLNLHVNAQTLWCLRDVSYRRICVHLLLWPVFWSLLSLTVRSLAGCDQEISPAEYAARRDSLAAHIDSGVVIAFGAPEPVRIGKWTQLPAFNYLTGFQEPNAAFLLVKRGGRPTGTLFTATPGPPPGALRRIPARLRHGRPADRAGGPVASGVPADGGFAGGTGPPGLHPAGLRLGRRRDRTTR